MSNPYQSINQGLLINKVGNKFAEEKKEVPTKPKSNVKEFSKKELFDTIERGNLKELQEFISTWRM